MDKAGETLDKLSRERSYHLMSSLNLNGASPAVIEFRISCFNMMESMYQIASLEHHGFFLGSQIEGTALLGRADEDIMLILRDIAVTFNIEGFCDEISRNQENHYPLGLILESTPGYAKIMAVDRNTGKPLRTDAENSLAHLCDVGDDGIYYFSTMKLKERVGIASPTREMKGPAMTESSDKGHYSSDLIYGLYTPSWPKSADAWLARKRNYNWPKEKTIKIAKEGCHLVPTGSSISTSSTDWRISFALIERELIWTWSDVQYKCFMLLKLIKAHLIEPVLPDIITSYQLKTLMFWISEERNPKMWERARFSVSVIECLEKLQKFIQNQNCPHYFIPSNNLFKDRLSADDKEKLCIILSALISDFWTEVFKIPCLQNMTQIPAQREMEYFRDMHSAVMKNPVLFQEVVNLHFSVISSFATSAMKPAFQFLTAHSLNATIKQHQDYRSQINSIPSVAAHNIEMVSLLNILIDISLGSQLYSKYSERGEKEENSETLQEAQKLLLNGCRLDAASGRLKLATLYFGQGMFQKAMILIDEVTSQDEVFQLSGFEPRNPEGISLVYAQRIILDKPDLSSTLRHHYALEIIFLPSEIYSALDPIKFEINRALMAETECSKDNPLMWVSIDANAYALLMKFFIFHNQEKYPERNDTLSKLREYVQKKNISFHRRITMLNITGYCLKLTGDIPWAIEVFIGSLHLQKHHNSAAWHLALIAWEIYRH